jgi:NAD dependent epimerase/dehydratase
MNDDFWSGKRVLVTGADGFIGSHLTEELARRGASVRAFCLYNSFSHWGWLSDTDPALKKNIEIFPGDIRDPNRVNEAVEGCSHIFHLASLIAIPYSYHAPDSYVQTNITGAVNVLNASRAQGIKRLVHTSTSEVYGTALYVPIDEKHPLQGQSPYSASKIGADMLAESFFRSFDLPVVIARPFNTYGPRQSARAVIPTILAQLHGGAKEVKLGSLTPTRDFNFVLDTVRGFLALGAAQDIEGEVLNLGSGREISIGTLADLLIEASGSDAKIVCEQSRLRPDKSEVNRLLSDASKAKELADWEPKVSLREGLAITSDWVKDNLHVFDIDSYTI